MPPFNNIEDLQRLDFQLLQNGTMTLYWKNSVLQKDMKWLKERSYLIYEFDCSKWKRVSLLHADFYMKLSFPEYYGNNLNALNDCLSDIEIPEEGGIVFVFYQFDQFNKFDERLAWHVLEIIENNARRFLLFGRRLIALIQSDDPKISIKPVGANGIGWNGAEWLNKNREL